jgi:hypothetical protein
MVCNYICIRCLFFEKICKKAFKMLFFLSCQKAIACSQSKSLSYYDYDANFCDVHNLMAGLGFNYTESASHCRFKPAPGQEAAICNKQ